MSVCVCVLELSVSLGVLSDTRLTLQLYGVLECWSDSVFVARYFFTPSLIHRLLHAHCVRRIPAVMPFPSNVTTQAASALGVVVTASCCHLVWRACVVVLPLCFAFCVFFFRHTVRICVCVPLSKCA